MTFYLVKCTSTRALGYAVRKLY